MQDQPHFLDELIIEEWFTRRCHIFFPSTLIRFWIWIVFLLLDRLPYYFTHRERRDGYTSFPRTLAWSEAQKLARRQNRIEIDQCLSLHLLSLSDEEHRVTHIAPPLLKHKNCSKSKERRLFDCIRRLGFVIFLFSFLSSWLVANTVSTKTNVLLNYLKKKKNYTIGKNIEIGKRINEYRLEWDYQQK